MTVPYKVRSVVLLLMLTWLLPGRARADVALGGQYRNLFYVTSTRAGADVGDLNGVRLDLQSSTGENELLRFRASLDLSYAFGSLDALETAAALTGPEGVPIGLVHPRLHLDLFRAFVQLRTPNVDVYLGRQRIAWGTGLILRPSDAFEPTDFFDPYRELAGVDALRVTVPLASAVYVDGVARLDSASGQAQAGLAMGLRNADTLELTASAVLDGIHERQQIGLSLRGNRPIKYWLDGAYRHQSDPEGQFDDTHQVLLEVGLEYTFPLEQELSVGAEYIFLSDGDPAGGGSYREEALLDYRVLQGRDYGYFQASLAVQDRLSAGLGVLMNLDDGSVVVMPRISGRPLGPIELTLGSQLYIGRSNDEFARSDVEGGGRGAALFYLMTTWYL